jgi:antitoxin component of RelBE/YafQ-DinJ toxin-antitoxin module
MTTVLQARFDEARLKKINRIQADTGLTVSQLFRRLVDAAEIKPLEISVNLSTNANDDITRQGSNVVVSA